MTYIMISEITAVNSRLAEEKKNKLVRHLQENRSLCFVFVLCSSNYMLSKMYMKNFIQIIDSEMTLPSARTLSSTVFLMITCSL